jgi:cobalt/nickel transport system permease protein
MTHFDLVDAYQAADSPLHQLDARLKVPLTLALILLIALTPMGAFGAYVAFFALIMGGALIAGVDPLTVVKRSLIALPFAGAAVTLVFTVPGPALGRVPLVGWPISEPGLVRFASILLKSMISVQVAAILLMTTHFTDVVWALGALRVPKVLVATIAFMYRYLFLLADEALRLTRARDARSASLGGGRSHGDSLAFRARTTGRMIGNLFVRSFARSERVYQAMVARGYRGEMRQLSPPPIAARDVLWAAVPLAIGGLILALSLLTR